MNKCILFMLSICFSQLPALSVVTVSFEQVNADVKVAWSGDLNIGGGSGIMQTPSQSTGVREILNLSHSGDPIFVTTAGINEITNLQFANGYRNEGAVGSWGFISFFFTWSAELVTEGSAVQPLTLTFVPEKQFFFLENTTLVEINAHDFNNTLAWTANTGDTINYLSVLSVPEPMIGSFMFIAALISFSTRKRT